jgi:hypothetical protein
MSFSIQCTHCHATLKSPKPVPAGKKVTCPKCKHAFTTPTDGPTTKFETTTSIDVPPPPSPEPEPALGDDDLDAAVAKLQAEQSAGKKPAGAPGQPPPPKPVIPNMEIPDDDLVDPEPEETPQVEPQAMVEPAPSKNRQNSDGEEEPRSRRNRDDDEDDEPQSRRSRADDEDEPRSKRKRRDYDDDDDDKPRSKRKRDDDDDDEDDEPRSNRKRRDRDDDDDDEPRSKKKKVKKSGSGAMMWILLAVGGVFGLLLCCGGGIGVYFLFPGGFGPLGGPNVVGRWEHRDVIPIVYEFKGNGTGQVEAMGTITWFDYRQRGASLDMTPTRVQAFGMDLQVPRRTNTINVSRDGDTLRMEGVEGRRGVVVLQRIN